MPSAKIVVNSTTATPDEQIDYWLEVWLNHTVDVSIRCTAAKRLDELLRAPVWST